MFACSGPQIYQVVGFEHDIAVVLYHQYRIANIPQIFECFYKAKVVALVKTNTGLIENIGDTCQLRSNLGGQSDTLTFAAGESTGGAVKGQIIQTHLKQKFQSEPNLLEYIPGNCPLPVRQLGLDTLNSLIKFIQIHFREFGNIHIGNFEPEALFLQSGSVAIGAVGHYHEIFGPLPNFFRGGFGVPPFKHVNQAFIGKIVAELVTAEQDSLQGFFGELSDGSAEAEAVFFGECPQLFEHHIVAYFAQRGYADLVDALFSVGNNATHVHLVNLPQPLAVRTHPVRRVEGERVGRGFIVRDTRYGAHQISGINCLGCIAVQRNHLQ